MRAAAGLTVLAALVTAACADAAPVERFYSLVIGGVRSGYARVQTERTDEGLQTTSETVIHVTALGSPFDLAYQSIRIVKPGGEFVRFGVSHTRNSERASADCRLEKGKLAWRVTSSGSTRQGSLPWTRDTVVVEGNCLDGWDALFLRGVPAGRTAQRRLFFPLAGAVEEAQVTALAVKSGAAQRYRVKLSGDTMEFVVRPADRVVTDFLMPSQKAAFRLGDRSVTANIKGFDVGTRFMALVPRPMPDHREVTSLRVRMRAAVVAEKVDRAFLQQANQRFEGTVSGDGVVEGLFNLKPLRYDGKGAAPWPMAVPAALKLYVRPGAKVESDAKEIRDLAAELTQGATSSWDAAQRIGRWVFANITYQITGTGALEALRTRKGDCGPHSLLTIALCRAAGIPAQLVGGALYSSALGGSFGQHYWVMVWVGKAGWVPFDPTSGEIDGLSPYHVTLWHGGALASLSVKVVSVSPDRKPSANSVASTPFTARVGERERYRFSIGGKQIGEQTAECTGVGPAGEWSEWRYSVTLELGAAPNLVNLKTDGSIRVSDRARPISITLTATVNGGKQQVDYTVSGDKANAHVQAMGQDIRREIDLPRDAMLQVNNLISALSFTTRAIRLGPGGEAKVPCLAATGLQVMELAFKAQPQPSEVLVGDRKVQAVVADIAPIATRVYLEPETGRILRLTADAQKLVVELVP